MKLPDLCRPYNRCFGINATFGFDRKKIITPVSDDNRNSGSKGYLLYSFASRPIIAVPDSSQKFKCEGLKCYRGISMRRMSFAWTTRLLTRLRLDRLLAQQVDSSLSPLLPFNFQDWLDAVRRSMDVPSAEAVIVWPPQPDRGRIYIHLLDAVARPLAFVKLSLDATNDVSLQHEAHTIEKLKALKPTTFHVPALIEVGIWNGHEYCVFEPIAIDAKPVKSAWSSFPKDCVSEYAGEIRTIDLEQLHKLAWWKTFLAVTPSDSEVARVVKRLQGDSVRVCNAHGDLTTANIIRVDNQFLIFDWEESCEDAPILTDEVMFFLGLNARRYRADPLVGLRELKQRFLSSASPRQPRDLIMALAFIHTANRPVATQILHNWDSLNNRR